MGVSATWNHTTLQDSKMPTNNVQPMILGQADAPYEGWALLFKIARQDEIAALLQQAKRALPWGMNQQHLLGTDDVYTLRATP